MSSEPKTNISPAILAVAGIGLVVLLTWLTFNWGQSTLGMNANSPETSASGGASAESGTQIGPTSGPIPSLEANSQIPSPVASAQTQDQQAQLDALKAAEEQAAAQAQQNQQLEQAPTRFECQVTGVRIGENRSLLRIKVSAPTEVPEVWVSVKTERGDQEGKILLAGGEGEQIVPLRNPTNGFRPTIKVYSLPVLTERYEMCSYR